MLFVNKSTTMFSLQTPYNSIFITNIHPLLVVICRNQQGDTHLKVTNYPPNSKLRSPSFPITKKIELCPLNLFKL